MAQPPTADTLLFTGTKESVFPGWVAQAEGLDLQLEERPVETGKAARSNRAPTTTTPEGVLLGDSRFRGKAPIWGHHLLKGCHIHTTADNTCPCRKVRNVQRKKLTTSTRFTKKC